MSTIRPPLTTSMTGPSTTPSSSLSFSMLPHARSYWARFLDSRRRPSLSSFWRTSASTFSPSDDDLVRVDVVADAQLAGGDHALALVPDVEEHFVLVDLDDRAVDELAVLDLDHRAVDGVGEGHAEVVDDDLTWGVVALLVERAEAARGGSDGGGGGGGGGVGQGVGCFRGTGRCVHGCRTRSSAPTRATRVAAALVDRYGDGRSQGTPATPSSGGRHRTRPVRRC